MTSTKDLEGLGQEQRGDMEIQGHSSQPERGPRTVLSLVGTQRKALLTALLHHEPVSSCVWVEGVLCLYCLFLCPGQVFCPYEAVHCVKRHFSPSCLLPVGQEEMSPSPCALETPIPALDPVMGGKASFTLCFFHWRCSGLDVGLSF